MSRFDRFKDAPWFLGEGDSKDVIIGGAGGIGSWICILLARMGYEPTIYDFDTIEEHNIGGQLYGKGDIGRKKVAALASHVQRFTGVHINALDEKFDKNSMGCPVMISAFDNMKARQAMFDKFVGVLKNHPNAIFIDGRLTMEQLQIFCIQAKNMREYNNEHLFPDSDVEDAPCTMKQTSHSACMIASHMVGFLTNHITNVKSGSEVRAVPFMWEYFIPIDMFQ